MSEALKLLIPRDSLKARIHDLAQEMGNARHGGDEARYHRALGVLQGLRSAIIYGTYPMPPEYHEINTIIDNGGR